MNRVCEVLNIEKPVIQGPMAWISTAPLVAAVSNAGGLGILGVGFAPEPFIRDQIVQTRKLTDKPFGMNTIMIPDNLEHITTIILDEKPPVVYADTIAGLDMKLCKKYFDLWHSVGCKVVVKASFIEDAVIAEKAGADVMIVKGWEGGGHVTFEATTVLVPQAADLMKIPVIASGGLADGRGMAAAIALGAEGFEMGTAFMAAVETTVHPNVKKAVIEAGDMSTVITGYCTDEPCRQIKNKLADEMIAVEANNTKAEAAKKLRPIAESSLKKAMAEGDMIDGAVMAGQITALVKKERTSAAIIDEALAEAKEILAHINEFQF
ncbi:Nitronate monooxygenase [uncultured Roseburia sp.]|uniref:Probable nitronate monooxygenase n=1 Tax=Brotonthovivens ammoniilytica TaxID=2981725 RepID=A0ABT2TFD5_9FIRM|nr:nitronate monooxygenase [Brotonthovivens ammoniilytica]MCU6760898.1 nitronate monooxygenase [Brotonthovivens ammoniilytica]SCI12670.1 Nitronate monooxygenase [uncultured Roseburia sp.]